MNRSDPVSFRNIDWLRCAPFLLLHLAAFAVLFVGVSPVAVGVAAALYLVRMFILTGFYHRYFSHRSFKTSRAFQFLMALAGTATVQRGPVWWAAHHRHHHAHSDQPEDLHSPRHRGFFMSHMGWFMTREGFKTRSRYVKDWLRYPELRFIDRFDWIMPVVLAVGLFALGEVLAATAPELGTHGWQMLVWGFVISTIVLYHVTYTINSLMHRFGRRRFETDDDSRNSLLLALLTLGEGWHNNHHHHPGSARQGFYWWEIDITWYGLRLLALLGLIHDLRPVPRSALARAAG